MAIHDPITDALMAKGAPFEVVPCDVNGKSLRVFKHAPSTLYQIIEQARDYGDTEFIVSGDRRLTYNDFFAAVDSFAARLELEFKVKPGQSVAICMKNSPEWMISFVAILKMGAVAVLVNSRGTAETMQMAVQDTDSVLVLLDKRRYDMLSSVEDQIHLTLLDKIEADEAFQPRAVAHRDADDLCAMFFTSGTTGRAKAAAMSNRALVTGVMNVQMAMTAVFQKMAAAYNMDVETLRSQMPQSCSLLIFPLFHTSGCSSVFLTTIMSGGKLVLMNRWSAEEALRLIEQERVTIFGGVPATHWDVLGSEAIDKYDLSSLVSISNWGQAFPRNLMTAIRERFPKAYIGAGYGMTETSGSISQANGEALVSRPRASGQILPMVDVRIKSDDGADLAVGEAGEIWVKGATLMTEYYGRPEDTQASFSGEWYKTGDVGYIDEDDYIYIVDRKTDMIISGGENIYCVEVEAALNKHPDVLQICSFGVPDDRLGEKLVACYVSKTGRLSPAELESFAKDNLAAYRVPKICVHAKSPFELNAMGKIEKRKVRKAYLSGGYT